MFRMSSCNTNPEAKTAGTIRLKRPVSGLGNVTDVEGRQWNIRAIIGRIVHAVPLDELHPYFSDTSSFSNYGLVSQSWSAYDIEVVEQE